MLLIHKELSSKPLRGYELTQRAFSKGFLSEWGFDLKKYTGVAQLVEQWSPKPKVVSSNLTTRAMKRSKTNE